MNREWIASADVQGMVMLCFADSDSNVADNGDVVSFDLWEKNTSSSLSTKFVSLSLSNDKWHTVWP